jgi:predicted phosphodiesterase
VESLDAVVERCGSKAAAARELGIPSSTFKDMLAREQHTPADPAADVEPGFVEIPVIFRDYSHLRRLYLYPLGDVHLGARSHNADAWAKWLGYLESRKETSLLGTGDFLNSAIIGSKSEVYDETTTVGKAKRLLRKQLGPLAAEGRIDALAPGNHEARVFRAVGDCPIEDVCDTLDIPYIEASALIVYQVGDVQYRVFLRHGTGNGQSAVALYKGYSVIDADVYVTGHVHRQVVTSDDYFKFDGERIVRSRRFAISSGSFLGYETYAAQRGYSPGRIGAPRIFLDGERWDVHASL